jgi:hypothetical protein
MGRPLRIEYPDAFYHITARGNERQNIFKSNRIAFWDWRIWCFSGKPPRCVANQRR